jgi:RNA polymerase sigma-70 factor, ECF subfamily
MVEGREALDQLITATYQELRRLAAQVRRGESAETLNTTALVNEAYLKLSGSLRVTPESRLHFKRLAARAMRQVLIEAARRRKALKRGGDSPWVTLDDGVSALEARSADLIALDDALQELEVLNPRQAKLVEYRYFGGLNSTETAELLGVSESTVLRDWRVVRAWLAKRLREGD